MTDKREAEGGSEQKAKKQRDESAAADAAAKPSSASARAAQADALMERARSRSKQVIECSKLARLVSNDDSRPLDQRVAYVTKLLQEDEKRQQPLLNLSYEVAVS